jgi:hypothetical protein
LKHYKGLLELRAREIAPRLEGSRSGTYRMLGGRAFEVKWPLNGGELTLLANCGSDAVGMEPAAQALADARPLWSSGDKPGSAWSAGWWLKDR